MPMPPSHRSRQVGRSAAQFGTHSVGSLSELGLPMFHFPRINNGSCNMHHRSFDRGTTVAGAHPKLPVLMLPN